VGQQRGRLVLATAGATLMGQQRGRHTLATAGATQQWENGSADIYRFIQASRVMHH